MPRLAVERWEQEHRQHVADVLAEIDALYQDATDEMVRLGMAYDYTDAGTNPFRFQSNKARNEQVARSLSSFSNQLLGIVTTAMASEWAFANEKTDSWVKRLYSNPKDGYMLHNLEALDAFIGRKQYGHTLSSRVWDYSKQFQRHIEWALSVGIAEGRSATNISRDVRSYLIEPDRLFQRVRDRYGNLVLSKPASAYHPGQGVYRSSYQNAIRMARTEVNGAYREADHIRWQQLDFIVGIEVKTSKTHKTWLAKDWLPRFKKRGVAPEEICDTMKGRYPKDFKFIGWHPNCRCYAVPIIANEGVDGVDWWDEPQNEVNDVPDKFKEWLSGNSERLAMSEYEGKTPYFLTENNKYVNLAHYRSQLNMPQIRKAVEDNLITDEHPLLKTGKEYTKGRQALQNRIVQNYTKGYSVSSDTIYMLGGAPANGKSTLVDSGLLPHPKGAMVVDADKVKGMIPEYRNMLKSQDKDLIRAAANFVHEESSMLGKRIQQYAFDKDIAMVIDGVNDGAFEKVSSKVTNMRELTGKRVRADYVSLDTELSVKLAQIRAEKTGREVPLKFIKDNNREISKLIPKLIENKTFDELYLWDTNINGTPRLILEQVNGVLKIHDQSLYDRFLKKAN